MTRADIIRELTVRFLDTPESDGRSTEDWVQERLGKQIDEATEDELTELLMELEYREMCPICKTKNINTDGGDCYCAECGYKWSL